MVKTHIPSQNMGCSVSDPNIWGGGWLLAFLVQYSFPHTDSWSLDFHLSLRRLTPNTFNIDTMSGLEFLVQLTVDLQLDLLYWLAWFQICLFGNRIELYYWKDPQEPSRPVTSFYRLKNQDSKELSSCPKSCG